MSSFYPRKATAFADADEFLNKGRNKNNRPVQNNTSLRRVSNDDIALVLHHTAVVTYHRDGTQTIFGGGWNTVTTKDRISSYSAVNPGSDGNDNWVIGHTGEFTPAKVQKCRKCSKTGPVWISDDECWGPGWYNMCSGGTTAYAVPLRYTKVQTLDGGEETISNSTEWYESKYIEPCEHGKTDRHPTEPCSHGEWKRHVTGQSEKHCYSCNGTGRRDYGSKPIPVLVSPYSPFKVDADGNLLSIDEPTPDVYAMRYVPKPKRALSTFEWEIGSEITDAVLAVVPTLHEVVKDPSSGRYDKVSTIVLTLHDTHHWSDERIMTWLATLND